MSFSPAQAESFFDPLVAKTTTLLVEGRRVNLSLARAATGLAAGSGASITILDLDAFYSSNADSIFTPGTRPSEVTIRVPPPGTDVEHDLSALFQTKAKIIIIDSLNTLYHLISAEDGSSRSRRLAFAIASLSYFARLDSRIVFMTMYKRERLGRSGTTRSISGLSDATVLASLDGETMALSTERGQTWAGGRFSTRIPSG